MVPVLKNFVLPHATPIAFLAAYGELAIGIALVFGRWVRAASLCGLVYMATLLFSSNYPGSPRSSLAILRGVAESSCARALFRGVCDYKSREKMIRSSSAECRIRASRGIRRQSRK